MRTIGNSLDRGYRDDLNWNFSKLEAMINNSDTLAIETKEELLKEIANLREQLNSLNVDEILALINQMQEKIVEANSATILANEKATLANNASVIANEKATLANNKAVYAQEKGDYANEKALLANEAAENANTEAANLGQLKTNVVSATQSANTATENANQATANTNVVIEQANNVVNRLEPILPNVEGLDNLGPYLSTITYKKNNIVEYNGSSFQALKDTTGNKPPTLPTKLNEFWQLIAQRGVDGEGSVSTVNRKSPGVDGNVELTAEDVGALPFNTEFETPSGVQEKINIAINQAITGLVNGAPGALDTLKELADALGDDPNFSITVLNRLTELNNLIQENTESDTTHKADNTAHGIGNETLLTTAKTLKGAINEVFTNGNNVKRDTVGALLSVDDSLPITTDSPWNNIISEIGNIETGNSTVSLSAEGYGWAIPHVNSQVPEITDLYKYTECIMFGEQFFIYAPNSTTEIGFYYDINTSIFRKIPFPSGVQSLFFTSVNKVGNKLYFFGGRDQGNVTSKKGYSYDLALGTWQSLADIAFTCHSLSSFVYNNRIYYFGSNLSSDTTFSQSLYYYDIATNTHKFVITDASMFSRRSDRNFVAVGDKLYLTSSSNFYLFNLTSKTASSLAGLGSAKQTGIMTNEGFGLMYDKTNNVIVLPPYPTAAGAYNTYIDYYNITTNQWNRPTNYNSAFNGVHYLNKGRYVNVLGAYSRSSDVTYNRFLIDFNISTNTIVEKEQYELRSEIVGWAIKDNIVHALNNINYNTPKLLTIKIKE